MVKNDHGQEDFMNLITLSPPPAAVHLGGGEHAGGHVAHVAHVTARAGAHAHARRHRRAGGLQVSVPCGRQR